MQNLQKSILGIKHQLMDHKRHYQKSSAIRKILDRAIDDLDSASLKIGNAITHKELEKVGQEEFG